MHLTLDALLVLDAIDRGGSFAAGAEELLRVPSAVSYTIQKLEQDLGVILFDRSGYRAKLTAAGSQLLKDGRELLLAAEQVERRARDVDAGCEANLAIAVGDLVPLAPVYALLRAFSDAPAHQSTQIKITTEAQATSLQTLVSGGSDIVIGGQEREAIIDGVRTRVLGEVELALAVPPTHPLASVGGPLTRQMLAPYRVVRNLESSFEDSLAPAGSNSLAVDDYASQVEAIRHGLGIGYVPLDLVHDDVEAGRLVTKTVSDRPRLRLIAAWRAGRVGKGVQWFVDQLGDETIRARLIPRSVRAHEHDSLADSRDTQPRVRRGAIRHDRWGPSEREMQSPG